MKDDVVRNSKINQPTRFCVGRKDTKKKQAKRKFGEKHEWAIKIIDGL